jgi:MFS family permease
LLFGLFAGVWADRQRRRPLLILADVGRGCLLFLIPLTAWLGLLSMELLYLVIFCTGLLGLVFGVAYNSYLPSLVPREQLIAANSRLALSTSAAEIAGPGLAGWLTQVVTAPVAILVDAISFLFSALLISSIRGSEAKVEPVDEAKNVWREIGAGLRFIGGNPILRAITGGTSTVSFFNAVFEAVSMLYMIRNLELEPALLGIIFGGGSVGFLVGALLPERLATWFGLGPTIMIGFLIPGLSDFMLPLVSGSKFAMVGLLTISQICFGLGLTLYNVGQVSLRQAVTPDHLLGRMNATLSFAVSGIVPLGALAGGALGELVGIRATLLLAASGELLAVLWLIGSPIRSLRQAPALQQPQA